ncbi:DNA-directed RNA polymerase III subunit RPC4 [Spatholobus suberectus]|nr:DNA-directed RNA polymerase III subunit RPC4 [Spatholobus suberectus]
MDLESSKDAARAKRKVKFVPIAPPRRVPKKEVKNEVVEDAGADEAKDLLRRFNCQLHKLLLVMVENRFLSNHMVFPGVGVVPTSVRIQHSVDYYTNYPVALPLRRPYSGNPEHLDEEEFGEATESRTYNENASNSAMELGLLEENFEANMFLINLPLTLPMIKESDTAGGQNVNANSKPPGGAKKVEKPCKLHELPSGFMGKMLVYKSGAIKLKLGNTLYDVSSGMKCAFAQDLVAINTAQKHCCTIGEISKHATTTIVTAATTTAIVVPVTAVATTTIRGSGGGVNGGGGDGDGSGGGDSGDGDDDGGGGNSNDNGGSNNMIVVAGDDNNGGYKNSDNSGGSEEGGGSGCGDNKIGGSGGNGGGNNNGGLIRYV